MMNSTNNKERRKRHYSERSNANTDCDRQELIPSPALLSLLKTVGAQGSYTPSGNELYNAEQLYGFLVAYIRQKMLCDPRNHLVVYCKSDPLGKVFGVEQFTKQDALSLLLRNCANIHGYPVSIPSSPLALNLPLQNSPPESKKQKLDDSRTSNNTQAENRRSRGRTSSLSIVYSSDVESRAGGSSMGYHGDYDWRLTFTSLRVADTDSESVYSVQSKETVYVCDSSDDYWFVEEENEDDLDSISVQMSNEGISVEFTGEECEIVSEHSASDHETDGSESPCEEIYVVYQTDDELFWADSESSDTECESMSGDEEISELDKWTCPKCDESNYPLRRNCDRCWELRPSWLPKEKAAATKSCKADTLDLTEICIDPPLKLNSSKRVEKKDLVLNDSGLGASLTNITLPDALDSGISSQECSAKPLISTKGNQPECAETRTDLQKKKLHSSNLSEIGSDFDKIENKLPESQETGGNLKQCASKHLDPCVICLSRPKEASIIHGKTGHQVCCYLCAKRLKRKGKPCPVCRRPILSVIKNYLV